LKDVTVSTTFPGESKYIVGWVSQSSSLTPMRYRISRQDTLLIVYLSPVSITSSSSGMPSGIYYTTSPAKESGEDYRFCDFAIPWRLRQTECLTSTSRLPL